MPKVSGYPQARDAILRRISEEQSKELERAQVASMIGISVSCAGNYLSVLASEFPENLQYVRGVLIIKSVFPEGRLPPSVRLEAKQKRIDQIKKLVNKIHSNHLQHSDKKELEIVLKQLKKDVDSL
jgi:hypothetical protein